MRTPSRMIAKREGRAARSWQAMSAGAYLIKSRYLNLFPTIPSTINRVTWPLALQIQRPFSEEDTRA